MKELVLFLSDMKDRNVGICSVRQGFDTSTSMGEIMFQFVGILSSWEREMIRERTLAGLYQRLLIETQLGDSQTLKSLNQCREPKQEVHDGSGSHFTSGFRWS